MAVVVVAIIDSLVSLILFYRCGRQARGFLLPQPQGVELVRLRSRDRPRDARVGQAGA